MMSLVFSFVIQSYSRESFLCRLGSEVVQGTSDVISLSLSAHQIRISMYYEYV